MFLQHWKTTLATALCAVAYPQLGLAQVAPPAILEVDVENYVQYVEDTGDVTKYATLPNVVPAVPPKNFYAAVYIGDIVAVNGQPAKGTVSVYARRISLTPTPNPGDAIADTGRVNIDILGFEFLTSDGTLVGSLMTEALGGVGTPPPGSPPGQTQGNNAITGGTGAFLGARGTQGQIVTPQTIAARPASITEDPAKRRINGGGRVRFVLEVIPMNPPTILAGGGGPAVTHSNGFSLVTASKPAATGENLSLFASGLGPTVPGVAPGQPFPSSPLAAVNSPVQVTVNGKPAQVLGAAGFPGAVDGYQVNFRVPTDAAKGMATVQVSAAWIAGPAVNIPIQ